MTTVTQAQNTTADEILGLVREPRRVRIEHPGLGSHWVYSHRVSVGWWPASIAGTNLCALNRRLRRADR